MKTTREELRNYPTRYEIILQKDDCAVRLGFDAKKTKQALFNAMRANGDLVVSMTNMGDDDCFEWKRGEYKIKDWTVRFSGQTERDFL